MGILLGANIGTNYKGILNLNTLNGNLSGTLQAVTDGDGNASLLKLSTTEVDFTYAKVRGTANAGVIDIFGAVSQDLQFWTADGGTRFGYITAQSDGIEFLASTSRFLSFGAGNAEGMRLTATRNLAIGTTSASARLQVRGDGTNPIARFENSAGSLGWTFISTALTFEPLDDSNHNIGSQFKMLNTIWTNVVRSQYRLSFTTATQSQTSGDININEFATSITAAAGSANFRPISLAYTINNSGAQTGTATGIFLNATETELNGMGHNLIDLQTGGVSRFNVDNGGYVNALGFQASLEFRIAGKIRIASPTDGLLTFYNNGSNDFNRLQLGGTTNAFPALKRNGAGIEFRLADDSAACAITAAQVTSSGNVGVGTFNGLVWAERSIIGSPSDGTLSLNNQALTDFSRLQFGPSTKPAICQGAGTPEGAVTAPVGSIFMRSDGGAGTSFYVKESGTGNTGWVAK
jgi:hypothetical protein